MTINKDKLASFIKDGKVKISFHASRRLQERGIGKDAALSAMLNGRIEFSSQGRDTKYCAKQGKLRVVFADMPNAIEIVSVFWL